MANPRKSGAERRKEQFDEKAGAVSRDPIRALTPSGIDADHNANQRWLAYDTMPELVPYIGPRCCFSAEQIEKRLASLKAQGQITPVTVYSTATGRATLVDGYLRLAAFQLAEVRGELEQIPKSKGKIQAVIVAQPKTTEDYVHLADRNVAENMERESLSDADLAIIIDRRHAAYVRELRKSDETLTEKKASGLAVEKLAEKFHMSPRNISRYRQLSQRPQQALFAVHIGAWTMSEALKKASENGEGSAHGPRKYIKHSTIDRAVAHQATRPRPNVTLGPDDVLLLLMAVAGHELGEDVPPNVQKWVEHIDAPKDLGKPAPKDAATAPDTKKAPAKRGGSRKKKASNDDTLSGPPAKAAAAGAHA
jgi:ParB-like chromosome segregation protein Spo0J